MESTLMASFQPSERAALLLRHGYVDPARSEYVLHRHTAEARGEHVPPWSQWLQNFDPRYR
jgi:hypothetical protein